MINILQINCLFFIKHNVPFQNYYNKMAINIAYITVNVEKKEEEHVTVDITFPDALDPIQKQ